MKVKTWWRIKPIQLEEIRNLLVKLYYRTHGGVLVDRELIVVGVPRNTPNCYFMSLDGTPPKGYAIYRHEVRELFLYDATGKIFRIYGNVTITEIEEGKPFQQNMEL